MSFFLTFEGLKTKTYVFCLVIRFFLTEKTLQELQTSLAAETLDLPVPEKTLPVRSTGPRDDKTTVGFNSRWKICLSEAFGGKQLEWRHFYRVLWGGCLWELHGSFWKWKKPLWIYRSSVFFGWEKTKTIEVWYTHRIVMLGRGVRNLLKKRTPCEIDSTCFVHVISVHSPIYWNYPPPRMQSSPPGLLHVQWEIPN